MNAATANLINAIILIALGAWGYFGADKPSPTALIPVGFGVVLLCMYPGVLKHNKMIAHIAVSVTLLLLLLALIMPLMSAIGKGNSMAIYRVAFMMVSCAVAMFFFIKSFIDARKAREAAENA